MTSPFTTVTPPALGADPGTVQFWRRDTPGFWLGKPEAATGMIQLPDVDPANYTATGSTGAVIHGLLDGGQAKTEFDSLMRVWTLSWPFLAGRDWQIINGFDRHLFGADPLLYVQPEDVNMLTLRESMCGALDATLKGWVSNGGTPAITTGAPYQTPSGIMSWAPGASGKILHNGKTYGLVDTDHAAPYLPAKPTCASFWVKTASGSTTVQARVSGRNAAGTVISEATSAATSVNATSWTLVTATAPAGTLGLSLYVLAELVSASTTTLLICCPQLENNLIPSPWGAGAGTPRVMLTTSLNRTPDVFFNSAATMTLTECVTGAA